MRTDCECFRNPFEKPCSRCGGQPDPTGEGCRRTMPWWKESYAPEFRRLIHDDAYDIGYEITSFGHELRELPVTNSRTDPCFWQLWEGAEEESVRFVCSCWPEFIDIDKDDDWNREATMLRNRQPPTGVRVTPGRVAGLELQPHLGGPGRHDSFELHERCCADRRKDGVVGEVHDGTLSRSSSGGAPTTATSRRDPRTSASRVVAPHRCGHRRGPRIGWRGQHAGAEARH